MNSNRATMPTMRFSIMISLKRFLKLLAEASIQSTADEERHDNSNEDQISHTMLLLFSMCTLVQGKSAAQWRRTHKACAHEDLWLLSIYSHQDFCHNQRANDN